MIRNIGIHAISDSCITSAEVDRLMLNEKAAIFYSDPPWGDGNLKYWVTLNHRHTGRQFNAISYHQLIDRICQLIRLYVDGHVFLETGINFVDDAISGLGPVIDRIKTFKIRYRSGSRFIDNCLIHGFTHRRDDLAFDFDPTGMTGYSVVERCILAASGPGEIVFDPCCGMGYSARAAVNAGMRFRGNEFNTKRLEKTIEFLKTTLS